MTTRFLGDTAYLLRRSLRHILRSADTIITTAITPIAMMPLFVYVFGGAINTGTDSYVTYPLPDILLITIASGISYTAFRLFLDMKNGIVARFQSMPITRSSILWAHVLTSLHYKTFRETRQCQDIVVAVGRRTATSAPQRAHRPSSPNRTGSTRPTTPASPGPERESGGYPFCDKSVYRVPRRITLSANRFE